MFHAADGYDRLIGRFLPSLAPAFADFAGVRTGSALDVGCGPGGLTIELARRIGAANVAAIDPSPPFVAACRERVPGAEVVEGVAETLPFPDGVFDAALSSLAVGFMSDAQQGVREMARVTRAEGAVALCFWDHARMQGLAHFWKAVHRVLGVTPVDDQLMGRREGELASLLDGAGLVDIHASEITATARYEDVDDLWSGYTARIGPIGQYVQTLTAEQLDAVRAAVREDLDEPDRPFTLTAVAWAARGAVPA
ncbi:class I SAM-dependent methyltransferase [Microbacterium sp. NPDC089987]|uniref:class I SAM-dependent methyltransferase n=1 Tax=Microbacterium sp. NPDC089987 TaxID=3364202 RepID=UPI0037FB8AC6